jgi:metal-dependent HD superfamily phosphatase/phosphodiesterase
MTTSTPDTTPAEIVARLVERFPQVEIPSTFLTFLGEQEENGHQLRRVDSGETLVEFFEALKAPQSQIAASLTPDSHLLSKLDYHALIQLPADQIYTYLVDHLAPLFELQQVALDSEMTTGFNSHGREHVCTVASNAAMLLKQLHLVSVHDYNEKEAILGGLLHDLGNLLRRKFHGLYGIYLLTQLFGNYAATEPTFESFLTLLEIVMFHEVEFGSQQALFEQLNAATLSVIIADKTDVSFRRVSAKSNVPEAMLDAHVLVNLLVANSRVQRKAGNGGQFCWTVDFRTKLDASQGDLFSSLVRVTGRVKYPQEWIALYEEGNIEYLFLFQSTFLKIYLSRLYLAMRAVFMLYPSTEEFLLVVDDAERGISISRVFTRKDYQHKIRTLGKLFYREAWPDTYLYRALE